MGKWWLNGILNGMYPLVMLRYILIPEDGAPKIEFRWLITTIARTYGRYIELVNRIINQLKTGGHHLVPFGNLRNLWKITIDSGFSQSKWSFFFNINLPEGKSWFFMTWMIWGFFIF